MIMFGNNIAPKSEVKTRRAWHPNVVHKSLYSAALCRWVRLKITVRALRTIDKVGGLDNYLLGGTAARLKELGEHGWKLRWAVMTTKKIQEQMKQDSELRRAVGYMGHVARHPEELTQPATVGEEMSETVAETTEQIKEGKQDEGEEIEQRIRQRLEEDQLMREEPAPSRSLWQRVKGMFGRS